MTTTNSIGSSYPFATADYGDHSVTYVKLQNVAAGVLLGNSQGSPGTVEEVSIGSGLVLSGGVLSTTGSVAYSTVTTTSQSAAVNYGYVTNNAGLVTVTLPAIAAVGDVIEVQGLGAGGWKLAQNSGQLTYGSNGAVSTTGVSGYIASTNQHDFVRVRCIVANTTWQIQSVIGNLTIA